MEGERVKTEVGSRNAEGGRLGSREGKDRRWEGLKVGRQRVEGEKLGR